MILQEYMDNSNSYFDVKIFATDIDEHAINSARAGLFPEGIAADIGPERLKRHFIKENNYYRIKKNIREMLIFAPQNIIRDPPFTNLDLLCCRNLLIYFEAQLQKKIFPIFHYSLKPGGILFLGTSETIGTATDLFHLEEKKWKIFKRQPAEVKPSIMLDLMPPLPAGSPEAKKSASSIEKINKMDILSLVKSLLSQSHLPPCVVIDEQADILYVHGRIGRYLEPPEGETSINVLDMARPELKTALTCAIQRIKTDQQETVIKNLQLKENGEENINLSVRRFPDQQSGRRDLMLVTFVETSRSEPPADKTVQHKRTRKTQEIKILEEELQYTRENLQSTIEELETSNEELTSANEELQSTNEELQSTNEELETSREELQSLNEESSTVNAELQNRIDALSSANNDIKNLLTAIDIATIFLDSNLCIKRFTPKITELIPLTPTDIGRPLNHLSIKIKDVDLVAQAQKVLDDLITQEIMVESQSDHYYQMRMRPYRTVNNVIDGVVITFENITQLKKLHRDTLRLVAVVKDSNDAITLQDPDGNIIAWNKGAETLYGYSVDEALSMNIDTLIPENERENFKQLTAHIDCREILPHIATRQTKDGKIVTVWLTLTVLRNEKGQFDAIATTERDLSQLSHDALLTLTGNGHGEKRD